MLTASMSRRGGGVFEAVSSLSRALQTTTGISVAALGLRDDLADADSDAWARVERVKSLPVLGPSSFGFSPTLLNELLDARLDLLHVNGLWMYPSVASLLWRARTDRPVVVSPHGMLDSWALRQSRWKKTIAAVLFENPHLRRADCLHALCEPEARAIREYGLRNPIAIIPNGVDLPTEGGHVPPPWDGIFPPDAKVVLYLGRLHPKKNLHALLEAWAESLGGDAPSDWYLAIVGSGQNGYERSLRSFVNEHAVPRVWFAGSKYGAEKDACLANAQVFVLPSLSEGLPMAVLEAWSYRLPVVMTSACNLEEGFQAGAAIRIEKDVEGIAGGLRHIMILPKDRRTAMGNRGRLLVERTHTWSRAAQDLIAVYRWLLGEDSRPDTVHKVSQPEAVQSLG